jgi:IS5 family transposase
VRPAQGIVGALSLGNPYDGHTLPAVIEQYESIFGRAPSEITADRGYRGRTKIGQTTINIPKPFNDKNLSRHRQNKLRRRHPPQGSPRFLGVVPPRGVAGTALFVR